MNENWRPSGKTFLPSSAMLCLLRFLFISFTSFHLQRKALRDIWCDLLKSDCLPYIIHDVCTQHWTTKQRMPVTIFPYVFLFILSITCDRVVGYTISLWAGKGPHLHATIIVSSSWYSLRLKAHCLGSMSCSAQWTTVSKVFCHRQPPPLKKSPYSNIYLSDCPFPYLFSPSVYPVLKSISNSSLEQRRMHVGR